MDIPKTCWYCQGVNTMKQDKLGATCAECGATWCRLVDSRHQKHTPGAGAIVKRRKS